MKKDFKLFIIGLTIKKDSTDIRESISIKIWEKAKNIGLGISYYDPLIPSYMNIKRKSITSASLKAKDLIVILVNHKEIDKKVLLKANIPIIDTKNIFLEKHDNVYKF